MKTEGRFRVFRGFVPVLGLTLLAGCGRSKTPYDHAMDRAELSLERRDFDDTLAEWERAAELSETPDDRQEVLYRRAHLLLRLGKSDDGLTALRSAAVEFPNGARTPRIFLDLGRVYERRGDRDAAIDAYETLVLKHAESGSAKAGLERLIALDAAGPLASIDRWLTRVSSPSLRSYLRYRHASALAETAPGDALREFEAIALDEPLPAGLYTDEALLAAARMRASRGEFLQALAHLAALENAIENAWFVGSYRRPTYADALLLAGRIARDETREEARAIESFEKLVSEFPTSRLADDAAYERLLTIQRFGRGSAACQGFDDFVRDYPDSRFVRCRARVCDGANAAPACDPSWK